MATTVGNDPRHPHPGVLLHALARNWWLVLLRGICAIVFGVLAFIWPGATLIALVLLYGAFALADGIFALGAAISGDTQTPRWWLAVVGVLGVLAGLMAFLWPGLTAAVLQIIIAAWAITTGIMEIVGAIMLRKEIEDEWYLIAAGTLWVIFGLVLVLKPAVGVLALLYTIGTFAVIYGALLISFALRLRSHSHGHAAAH
jgi:uncharacterized membrane protein HdeD (DUF308 family)